MVMISKSTECCKLEQISEAVFELKEQLYDACQQGKPLHVVEGDIVRVWLQKVGLLALEGFIELHGSGDVGPATVSPQDRPMDRLEQTKSRSYLSLFGPLTIERTVYSAGNHQQEFAPLDAILGLPASRFSFVVQDFAQMLGVDLAWAKNQEVLERLLGIKLSVSSLEDMNRKMAEEVPQYRQQRPSPPTIQEEAIFVVSGDGKGVVMRKPKPAAAKETPSILPPETKGPQPGRKSMAIVGSVYSVAPYVRTAEQMLEILFREGPPPADEPKRPRPCGKHVWAAMDDEVVDAAGVTHPLEGLHTTFQWLSAEWEQRDPGHRKPLVRLMDGEKRLWNAADTHLPLGKHPGDADILDIMHVADYLWDVAVVFERCRERQEAFYYDRLGRLLRGEVSAVITGLKATATRRRLRGAKRQTIDTACGYFENNLDRMRYDEYLSQGYPIASGAIEGACRHLIKDRMERTGMRWVRSGAQSMLNLRSLWINGEWNDYQQHYINTQLANLYPNRRTLIQQTRQIML
jgi:hypothetical protein